MNRTLVAVLLAITGLTGLAMTACGGFFTVALLGSARDPYAGAVFVIAIPSLLVGVALLWFANKRYKVWRGVGATLEQIEASQPPGAPPDAP
jgi:hypothetical protein